MASDEKSVALKDVKLDPTQFDISVSTVLTEAGAQKYEDIFRKHNIGQCTLTELTDKDLENLGVDNAEIRQKIIDGVRNLPIFKELEDTQTNTEETCVLNVNELTDIFNASSQHLHRIYVSLVNNNAALKKSSNLKDCVLYRDKYVSDVALSTLDEMTKILDSMESALDEQMRVVSHKYIKRRNKKLLVGAVGSAVVAMLSMLLFKTLKKLQ